MVNEYSLIAFWKHSGRSLNLYPFISISSVSPSSSTDAKWIRSYMREADITKDDEILLNEVFDRIYNIHSMIEDNFSFELHLYST